MKKALLFFGMCVCFISTMMLGMTSAEAKIFIEGGEESYVRFSPQFDEVGNLYILNEDNSWGFGSKTNKLDENFAFYLDPEKVRGFDKYSLIGNEYRFFANDYFDKFPEDSDVSGYISISSNVASEFAISSMRTKNRLSEDNKYSENSKAAFTSELGRLTYLANDLEGKLSNGVIHLHPVLRFEAAMLEGDDTSNFTAGMNLNNDYRTKESITFDSGDQVYNKFNHICHSYSDFEIPFTKNHPSPTKLFFDVDSDSLNVPTTYKFKNIRVAIERYVLINSNDPEELQLLDGIGQVLAQRIIDYRSENNEYFDSIDDLQKVKGIGPATIKKIKDQGAARVYDYFN